MIRAVAILTLLPGLSAVADVVVKMPPPPHASSASATTGTTTSQQDQSKDHDATVAPEAASTQALENFARGEPAKDRSGSILAQMALPPNGGGGGAMYFNGTYGPGYWGWPYWGWYGYWGGYTWCPPQPCPPQPGFGGNCGVGVGARPVWNSISIGF